MKRFSAVTKFFILLSLASIICSVPSYLYIRYRLRDQVFRNKKKQLQLRLDNLASSFTNNSIQLENLPSQELRLLPEIGENLTIVSMDGKILFSSSPQQPMNPSSLFHSTEIEQAIHSQIGSAIRQENNRETLLYVTKLLHDPQGKAIAILRIGHPITITIQLFQEIFWYYHGLFIVVVTLLFVTTIVFYGLIQKPLNQLLQFLQRGIEREPSALSQKILLRTDEVGELARLANELNDASKNEALQASSEVSIRESLFRFVSFPLALTNHKDELIEMNAPFRQATEIDSLNEAHRFSILSQSAEYLDAKQEAIISIKPQIFSTKLAWMKQRNNFQIYPLPFQQGQIWFALSIINPHLTNLHESKESLSLFKKLSELLSNFLKKNTQSSIELNSFSFEMQSLLAQAELLHIEPTASIEPIVAVELQTVFEELHKTASSFLSLRNISLLIDKIPSKLYLANSRHRIEKVLQIALFRSIQDLDQLWNVPNNSSTNTKSLKVNFFVEETMVRICFHPLQHTIAYEDLEHSLLPLGGSCSSVHHISTLLDPTSIPMEHQLWIHFRRA